MNDLKLRVGYGIVGNASIDDYAYQSMVGELPKNESARIDGLYIVSTEKGMKGLAQSFLWEKINAYDQEHFLADHPEYGQLMPPGLSLIHI